MASIGHVAVGVAAGRLYGTLFGRPPSRSETAFRMVALATASLLPDADVVAFHLGIPYAAPFGHRGASHSLVAALAFGLVAGLVAAWQAPRRDGEPSPSRRGLRVFLVTALVVATHGPLDALTDGGEGVALLWPFSTERIFFPWRPIPVSPIGIRFFSKHGWQAARVELLAFLPAWLIAFWPGGRRRRA